MTGLDVFAVEGVDELFGLDLGDFVKRRDELVKELRAQGQKDAATAVKSLRKPSTVAWGVNRVARTDRAAVDALLQAGAAVRAAQAAAVQGRDDGGLRQKAKVWRDHINALAGKVAALVGEPHRDEAAASFEAASVDPALAEVLRQSHLTTAITPAGFGLAGMPEPPNAPPAAATPGRAESRPAPVPVPGHDSESESESESEADADADAQAAAAARQALADRERELERLLHRLRRAEQRLDQAREAVDDAKLAHADALRARDAAHEDLDALER